MLPRLEVHPLSAKVILHPNCAARKLNLTEKLVSVSKACARSTTIPASLDCCGFAGDRGLLFPELTASAAALEAAEVNVRPYDGYYSSNLTCEMGMSAANRETLPFDLISPGAGDAIKGPQISKSDRQVCGNNQTARNLGRYCNASAKCGG